MKCIDSMNRNSCLSQIMNKIVAYPEKEVIQIEDLSSDEQCMKCIMSALTILNTFGVADITETTVKVKSLTAKYFIKSLFEYINNGLVLLINWEEPKGKAPELNENNIFFGPSAA